MAGRMRWLALNLAVLFMITAESLAQDEGNSRLPGEVFRDCLNCPEMVVIPAGSFVMGASASEQDWLISQGVTQEWISTESPQHNVSIRSVALGKYDVTFEEWDACVAEGGCNGYRPADEDWGRATRPVINVSYDDAQSYIAWLNGKLRHAGGYAAYRLPSEAEWEYAARGKTTSKFWWGDDQDGIGSHAWYANNSGNQTHPVGQMSANSFGLYDMAGNVWQWVGDCWNTSYLGSWPDGRVNTLGDCEHRVSRGGSWINISRYLRSANRNRISTERRDRNLSFRLARDIP